MPTKRIFRNQREKVIAGVCAGIADYFDIDVAWVRLGFVLAIFAKGFGRPAILAYYRRAETHGIAHEST